MDLKDLKVEITKQDLETALAAVKANEQYSQEKDLHGFICDPRWMPQTRLCLLYQAAHRADPSIHEVGVTYLYRREGGYVIPSSNRTQLDLIANLVSDFDEYVLTNNPDVLAQIESLLPVTVEFLYVSESNPLGVSE